MSYTKQENIKDAEDALRLFAGYFENRIKLKVEKIAYNLGYNESAAFEAIQCAFAKVWYYPSFDMEKSRCKDPERAIIVWLTQIAVSQMHQFSQKGECTQIKDEEDLSVIEEPVDFISLGLVNLSDAEKMKLVIAMNKRLSVLDEKHRIVYLTYKAYQVQGKKLPRSVLGKLRKRLSLVQTTVRVYKKEACEALGDYKLLEL